MGTATTDSNGFLERTAGVNTAPIVTTPTLVSGTAQRFYTDRDCIAYVNVTGGSSGTCEVQIGPTSAVANTLAASMAAGTGTDLLLAVKLPAGWFIKVTVATATIAATTVVTD